MSDFEKLPARQQKAIGALLNTTSLTEASRQCGTSTRQLTRWLQSNSQFQEVYREELRSLHDVLRGSLVNVAGDAIQQLHRIIKTGTATERIKAAGTICTLLARIGSGGEAVERKQGFDLHAALQVRIAEADAQLSREFGIDL